MTNKTNRKFRKAKWRSIAIIAILLVAVLAGMNAWKNRNMISGVAPALQGVTLAGKPYILPVHPAQPVIVHFWGTWCSDCRAEQSSIVALAHEYPNFITIALKSGKAEEVAKYMREQGADFPVVNDPDGSISKVWGVNAVPANFIVAPDGKISYAEQGHISRFIKLRAWLAGI
jgi:thiol-disulfide isomerase/thioredoxin